MRVLTKELSISSAGRCEMHDITSDVNRLIKENDLTEGNATIFVPGATGGVTTIEYEPGLIKDFPDFFDRIAPEDITYQHDETWHDGNGHSHVRASLLGPSLTVPFSGGNLILGTWQQIIVVDFDNRSRNRRVVVQFIGE